MHNRVGLLKAAVECVYRCPAEHVRTGPSIAKPADTHICEGTVEVFHLVGHPTAQSCYAWFYVTGEESDFTTVEIPRRS